MPARQSYYAREVHDGADIGIVAFSDLCLPVGASVHIVSRSGSLNYVAHLGQWRSRLCTTPGAACVEALCHVNAQREVASLRDARASQRIRGKS